MTFRIETQSHATIKSDLSEKEALDWLRADDDISRLAVVAEYEGGGIDRIYAPAFVQSEGIPPTSEYRGGKIKAIRDRENRKG